MPAAKKKPEQDSVFRFILDGKAYEIDAEQLTFGEIEDLEVYFDAPYDEIELESGRGTMFMAFLAARRSNPKFTLDDIRKLPLKSLQAAEKTDRPT